MIRRPDGPSLPGLSPAELDELGRRSTDRRRRAALGIPEPDDEPTDDELDASRLGD